MRKDVFEVGERVAYDGNTGRVIEVLASGRLWGPDYRVDWESGLQSIVWGSDLISLDPPVAGSL